MTSPIVSSVLLAVTLGARAFEVGVNPQVFLGPPGWNATVRERILDSGARMIRIGRHAGAAEDEAVAWARSHGIKVLMFCGYTRGISGITAPVTSTSGQAARQQYANMCLADLDRLDPGGDTITHVEAWNEWNGGLGISDQCSFGQPPCNDGALYTDLLRKVYDTVKAKRPDILIVGGAVAGRDLDFMGKMLDAGAAEKMDLLSWHFYVKPATSCSNALDATAASVAAKFEACVRLVEDLFVVRGLTPKKQLFTEWGRVDNGTPARRQLSAETITAVHAAARKDPSVAGLLWFDLSGAGVASNAGFGLYDRQGVKKPAFFAFVAETRALGAPTSLRIVE